MTALTDALDTGAIPLGVGDKPENAGAGAYIVIWPDVPSRAPSTMNLTSSYVETWTAHCYGRSADAAALAAKKFTEAVYSLWMTTVDGRIVQYPEQLTALPLSVDRDADPDLYDYALEFRFRTSA